MKFGQVDNPQDIDFALPQDHPDTAGVLDKGAKNGKPEIYVGCAKWNRQDLKGFYPRGTKDELNYYGSQFNSIELNATFYNFYSQEQIGKWRDKTPDGFKFFPKIPQMISHMKRLSGVEAMTEEFCDSLQAFEHKLGSSFLQLHNNFGPKNFDRLNNFLSQFPKGVELAVEVRNTEWIHNESVAQQFYSLLESLNMNNIITDTAGRRDLLHMRLTTPRAFVRYVGANHATDYNRLDDWIERIRTWIDQGIEQIYFFVHQNLEKESPLLSGYFINKLNQEFGYDIPIPATIEPKSKPKESGTLGLFG